MDRMVLHPPGGGFGPAGASGLFVRLMFAERLPLNLPNASKSFIQNGLMIASSQKKATTLIQEHTVREALNIDDEARKAAIAQCPSLFMDFHYNLSKEEGTHLCASKKPCYVLPPFETLSSTIRA